ncbi:MAG: ABC transporter substrate-binding protein [Cyanobacteria bacterium]|nr:ABC transporter substrate-binding protein [Cyanobacteriota bacterium]
MSRPEVIRVAHSPDSDDAFMFYGLANNLVDTEGLVLSHHLSDIETLNRDAMEGKYEMTAISYHAYAYLYKKYALLPVGSSIGDKYGPVLIAKEKMSKDELKDIVVAIPGEMTTATLALKLWEPSIKTQVMPFDQIMEAVLAGSVKAGLIIHEGQLTFKEEGLKKIVDLGEWWFETTNLVLPLGGNAIRRDLDPDLQQTIARVMRRGIEYSLAHREEALDYAMQFARGLARERADRFVDMYVNQMTLDASADIRRAVRLLLYMGHGFGFLPEKVDPEFLTLDSVDSVTAATACCH